MDDQTPESYESPADKQAKKPSWIDGWKRPFKIRDTADKAKDKAKDAAKQTVRQAAKQLAKKVLAAIGRALASAAAAVIGAIGGWWVLAIAVVIFIILAAISCSMFNTASVGWFGKSSPKPAGKDSQIVADLKGQNSQPAKNSGGLPVAGFSRLDLQNSQDKDYINSGQIDARLAEALKYLADKHNRIMISHIISDYINMDTNPESGADRDPQLVANVSAHKDGLAADVAEIDFVYKVLEVNEDCTTLSFGKIYDLAYYREPDRHSGGLSAIPEIDEDSINELIYNLNTLKGNLVTLRQKFQGAVYELRQSPHDPEMVIRLERTIAALDNAIAKLEGLITNLSNLLANLKELRQALIELSDNMSKLNLPEEVTAPLIESVNTAVNMINSLTRSIPQINILVNKANTTFAKFVDQSNNLDSRALAALADPVRTSLSEVDRLFTISQVNKLGGINQLLRSAINTLRTINSLIGNSTVQAITNQINNLKNQLNATGNANQLLKLECQGVISSDKVPNEMVPYMVSPNTVFGGNPLSQAVPIKVSWQDTKPDIAHVGNTHDESLTTDPRIFYIVYQPEARRKVHQVIGELLQFPYDKVDWRRYRVTQLITFSEDRDVAPFAAALDRLYDKVRPANFGLFAMPESWPHIHIGY